LNGLTDGRWKKNSGRRRHGANLLFRSQQLSTSFNHFLKNSINFKNNKFMVEKLLTSLDKLLYAVYIKS